MQRLRGRPPPLWLIGPYAFLVALWTVYARAGLIAVGLPLLLAGVLMFLWASVDKLRGG